MKVECINIIDPNTKEKINSAKEGGGLVVGKIYLVLEIYILSESNKILLRLDNDKKYYTPAATDARSFKTICSKIPSNWVTIYEDSNLYIGPKKWLDDSLWEFSFWEDYLSDTCPEAERVFEEERQKIRDEVG